MKKLKFVLSFILVALVFSCNETSTNNKDVLIILGVDAEKLYKIDPQPTDLNTYCILFDNNGGSSPNGTLENFKSNVFKGKKVTWQGVPINTVDDADYSIEIESIDSKGVNNKVLVNRQNIKEPKSKVTNARVKGSDMSRKPEETYTIKFSITKDGNTKIYTIDPKLGANN